MPVHQFLHDHRLLDLGLRNYWGYNTFGFFAPHYQYASIRHAGGAVAEFKTMVRTFHEAGIEVILDVVYNHTAEGNHLGPTINFRGIDNAAYYRLLDGDLKFYKDFTGTGNSLNARHPHTLQLIMDSLRYWVLEMHVDGFRFDLASTLAREFYDVDRLSRVLRSGATGSGGQPGQADRRTVGRRRGRLSGRQFPRFVDRVEREISRHCARLLAGRARDPRRVRLPADRLVGPLRGHRPAAQREHQLRHLPRRLHAATTWCPTTRNTTRPTARTTATAKATTGRGTAASRAPPTTRTSSRCARKQMRNIIGTLMLSQGTPMIAHGDEIGRTQRGNNNVYCQDSELSWMDWSLCEKNADLLEFTRKVTALRTQAPGVPAPPVLRGQADPHRRPGPRHRVADPGGRRDDTRGLGFAALTSASAVFLNGEAIPAPNERGERVVDDSFLLCFNAHEQGAWTSSLPTATTPRSGPPRSTPPTRPVQATWSSAAGEKFSLQARSLLVLRKTA